MNRHLLIGGIVGAAAATAIAGVAMLDSEDYAEVVAVEPVTTTVSVPREECRDHVVEVQKPVKDDKQITGTVAGAVIGGVLGRQVGGGSGKDIATVAGAAAGGYAGNKAQEKIQENNTEQRVERRCQTVYDEHEEPAGYEVTYLWDGQERVVHMDHDPGRRLEIEDGRPVLDR